METRSEWLTRRPPLHLAPFVDRYTGYRLVGFPPGLHRGLPSRHLTFIVSIGPSIDVVQQSDPAQSPSRYGCVVGGLQATPALIAHDGHQEGVAVELTPLGCRALFGIPPRALWSTSVELADVVGAAGRELWERLQGIDSWVGRFAACDDVLTGLADPNREPHPQLGRAWTELVRSGGTMPTSTLAASVGWSRQHFARRFVDEFGLGPKLASRVVRFERARHLLTSARSSATIASVAARAGYYDQAHLARDFAELAGCTPGAWMAEEDVPSFQDEAALLV
ncbi:MAG: Transcriptional regulator, AraC family [uncultured Acidimicrobiales bacterium]|uniref:Transcriptional regulator, AraC family n=1 Tax=uncultured Acidimicrobiales bacterium TaxID=310071 RepID=A0A6J4I9E2_9ACTN|nr:MAG: Transcriptional regulator, AraC family [uncultured Acidimicrobiales bacterium]